MARTLDPLKKRNRTVLSYNEELFVEAFCGPANFNGTEAYRLANYSTKNKDSATSAASDLLKRPHVLKAIKERLEERKASFWLTEDVILQKLWEEANRTDKGSSHAARIQALVLLGKHIGMWQDKVKAYEESSNVTYNIIQYNQEPLKEKVVAAIEDHKITKDQADSIESFGINLTNYNEDKDNDED